MKLQSVIIFRSTMKKISVVLFTSMLLEVAVSPLRAIDSILASVVEGLLFGLLTLHFLTLKSVEMKNECMIPVCVIIGGLILQLPSRIVSSGHTLSSIFSPISIVSGVLIAVYFFYKRDKICSLGIICIWLIITTIGQNFFWKKIVYPRMKERKIERTTIHNESNQQKTFPVTP